MSTYKIADYGVTHLNGSNTLQQQYGSTSAAQTALKDLWGWAKAKGWTDAEIMSLSFFEGAWHDAFWKGENGNYNSPNPGHAINIEAPHGRFRITTCLPFAQGVYSGQGSRFHDSSGTHSYGSTHLYIDHAGWKDKYFKDRIIMRSANWGVDGGYGAWVHHYIIEKFHFDGRRRTKWMPEGTAESAGIGAWDSGEASEIRNCYFDSFERDGVLLVRGTPVLVTACSAFNTSRFGFAIVGGGSVTLVSPSGDESGVALIGSIAGYSRPGSTRLAVFGAKQETSTSGEFRPWKGSSFLYAEGWINATIHGASYASGWTTPYDFITWKKDPNVGNFSSILVTGTHFFGNAPRCLFYNDSSGQEYLFQGNAWQNTMQSWVWHETQGLKTEWGTIAATQRPNPQGRKQHLGTDGATSWETSPIYSPTGSHLGVQPPPTNPEPAPPTQPEPPIPPPVDPPPTTVKASWDFNSGTLSRITAQVGTAMTPVSTATMATGLSAGRLRNNGTNARNMRYNCTANGIRVVKLIGLVPFNVGEGQTVLHSEVNYKGLVINKEGRICDNRSGGDKPLTPPLVAGQKVDLTIILPDGLMDVRFFGAHQGGGSSFQFAELDAMELL